MTKNKALRVAIFDFDDTLFYGQSHSYFISYIESNLPLLKFFYCKIRKRVVFKASTERLNKEFLLEPFKDYSKEMFDNIARAFYQDVIKKRLCKILLDRYFEHKSKGDIVIIASGGFDVYLKYFEQEYNADFLISTKLAFNNNFFTGKIQGEEALSENKAFMVRSLLINSRVDWASSFAYSDHVSDMPLFNLVGNKNLVDIGQDKSWVPDDFEIIKISD